MENTPRMISPGPCFLPARTNCGGLSTKEENPGSSAGCRAFELVLDM